MSKSYFVYMLTNTHANVLYTGVTNDLIKRVYQHKHKFVDGFTKKYNVNKLVYFEIHTDIYAAITREKQIKGWTRVKKNALIANMNPAWQDLYESLL